MAIKRFTLMNNYFCKKCQRTIQAIDYTHFVAIHAKDCTGNGESK